MSGTTGTIDFALDFVPQPANDHFAIASELSGDSATASGDTFAATAENGEPTHWTSAARSVWYEWTAPSDGRVSVDLAGSGFDTTIAAYRGDSLDNLTRVGAANDNLGSMTSRSSGT